MKKKLVGMTAAMMHPDPERNLFRPKTLVYTEVQMNRWLLNNDLIPILIPPEEEHYNEYLDLVDGVILFGGADVAPQTYGEVAEKPEWLGDAKRDAYEIEIIKRCTAKKIPLFGICRGLQILNVAFGGSLFQDINVHSDSIFIHRDAQIYDKNYHLITIEPGGFIDELYLNSESKKVNTIHHQAIKKLAPVFRVDARCPEDNIIEAISHIDPTFPIFGVQWHPEWLAFDSEKTLDPNRLLMYFKNKMDQFRK